MYALPYGYLKNGISFQGILDHPQTYGPFAAPMTSLLMGIYLFQDRTSRIVPIGIALGWLAILSSDARTALLAAVLGMAVVMGYVFVWNRQWISVLGRSLSRTTTLLSVLAILAFIVIRWDSLVDTASGFLLKGKSEMSITESLQDARTKAVTQSVENFKKAPITGIGFGVDSDLTNSRVSTGTFGLPTGAPVEKGLIFTAVLEEVGIFGAGIFLWLLVAIVMIGWKGNSIAILWMLMSALLLNMGEMVFFSLGGPGIYFWALIGLGYCVVEHARESGSGSRPRFRYAPSGTQPRSHLRRLDERVPRPTASA
jgi:hypothetical protein